MKRFKDYLKEAKKEVNDDRPEIMYLTKTEDMVDRSSEKITKVVAILNNEKESKQAMKLVAAFLSADRRIKQLGDKLKTLKGKIRNEIVQKYFDAADETFTRVVEMADATITISKKTERTSEKFDVEGFYRELLGVFPDAYTLLEELKVKYTDVKTSTVEPSVKVAVKEAMFPIFMYWTKFFPKLLRRFDLGFDNLLNKFHLKKEDSNENI